MKKNLGNVAIYLRVANKENNKEDSFIDFQKKEILNYLKKNCKDYKIEYFIENYINNFKILIKEEYKCSH